MAIEPVSGARARELFSIEKLMYLLVLLSLGAGIWNIQPRWGRQLDWIYTHPYYITAQHLFRMSYRLPSITETDILG